MKELLALKASYKAATGTDWTPNTAPPPAQEKKPAGTAAMSDAKEIDSKVKACGDRVRDLKAKKADKVNSQGKLNPRIPELTFTD